LLSSIESPDEWDALCGGFTDAEFTQSFAWGEARRPDGWVPLRVALRDGADVVAAAQCLIKSRYGLQLVYCPRGPVWQKAAGGDDALGRLLDALIARLPRAVLVCDWYVDRDTISEAVLSRRGFRPVGAGMTAHLDLRQDLAAIRAGFHKKWRNDLHKGEESAITITRHGASERLDDLYQLAGTTAIRKGFVVGVPEPVAQRFVPTFSGDAVVFAATAADGVLVSAALMVRFHQRAGYLVGASVPSTHASFQRGASNLIQWTALQWAQAAGAVTYNLEGLDPAGNPGVFHFKDRMGGRTIHQKGTWVRTGLSVTTMAAQALLRRMRPV